MESSKLPVNGTTSFIKQLSHLVSRQILLKIVYITSSVGVSIFLDFVCCDILLSTNHKEILYETKRFLSKKFYMKDLGEASFVLRIQIYQNLSRVILRLSQKAYIEKVLERYGMQDCKPGKTPVTKGNKFSLSQYPKNDLEVKEM